MKTTKMLMRLLFLTLPLFLFSSCESVPKTTVAINPLTYTDIPDNDVIRVGNDYYMVSTTMYFCPGAPIIHSRDLIHWRIVNYVYDTLADDDIYNLRNGRNAYGKGQWATTLREKDGIFYALFIANDQQKTFVYTTTDIHNGPWKRHAVYDRPFHDAGLLFDKGKAYVVWGNGSLRITELEPDLSAIKEGGVDQLLIETPRGRGLRAEGAHMYHINDYYYLLEIDWPAGEVRTERAWRSHELLGEYESKVILQGAFDGRRDGVAQGAIVNTPHGDWYSIMFQDHGAVGRIPTIQPVKWVDGWPILGDNTLPMKEVTVNLPEDTEGDFVWAEDEFDTPDLSLVWQWNHMPVDSTWSLSEREGWLRLRTTGIATDVMNARNTLTQRTVGPHCYSEVRMDASGMLPGDKAGICAFQSNRTTIGVEVAADGTKNLIINDVQGLRANPSEVMRQKLESDTVYLRINYVFTPAEGEPSPPDTATFAWSYDGENWTTPPYVLHMRYTLDLFTGYRTALYCFATQQNGGYADFDYFHQQAY